tara:strand:- start:16431 stop:17048 length:618 start_codon:yes stop_codon:yes gene_type:complete
MPDLPFIKYYCEKCGLVLKNKNICSLCNNNGSIFNKFIVVFNYKAPISKLIKNFKYYNNILNRKILGELLVDKILSSYKSNNKSNNENSFPEIIIPVPSYAKKLKSRGFNQSMELAIFLSERLNLKLDTAFIVKTKDTLSQVGLDREERLNNLANSFEIKNYTNYKHIAIVDDIVTTSATILALQKVIKNNISDIKVDIWCLAKK